MYKEMYTRLFNAVTDAIGLLERGENDLKALELLMRAQREAEEMYISE